MSSGLKQNSSVINSSTIQVEKQNDSFCALGRTSCKRITEKSKMRNHIIQRPSSAKLSTCVNSVSANGTKDFKNKNISLVRPTSAKIYSKQVKEPEHIRQRPRSAFDRTSYKQNYAAEELSNFESRSDVIYIPTDNMSDQSLTASETDDLDTNDLVDDNGEDGVDTNKEDDYLTERSVVRDAEKDIDDTIESENSLTSRDSAVSEAPQLQKQRPWSARCHTEHVHMNSNGPAESQMITHNGRQRPKSAHNLSQSMVNGHYDSRPKALKIAANIRQRPWSSHFPSTYRSIKTDTDPIFFEYPNYRSQTCAIPRRHSLDENESMIEGQRVLNGQVEVENNCEFGQCDYVEDSKNATDFNSNNFRQMPSNCWGVEGQEIERETCKHGNIIYRHTDGSLDSNGNVSNSETVSC